jgi:hypothetical protein
MNELGIMTARPPLARSQLEQFTVTGAERGPATARDQRLRRRPKSVVTPENAEG